MEPPQKRQFTEKKYIQNELIERFNIQTELRDNVLSVFINKPFSLEALSQYQIDELYVSANLHVTKLPPSLKKLVLGDEFNEHILELPDTLETLKIGNEYEHDVPPLGRHLKELFIGDSFNRDLPILPDSLQLLFLGNSFNRKLQGLPVNLETLSLGYSFNHPIETESKIKNLYLHENFSQPLPILPNLTHLKLFNKKYNHPIRVTNQDFILHINQYVDTQIPTQISQIQFGEEYNKVALDGEDMHRFIACHNTIYNMKPMLEKIVQRPVDMHAVWNAKLLQYNMNNHQITFHVTKISYPMYSYVIQNSPIDILVIQVNESFEQFPDGVRTIRIDRSIKKYEHAFPRIPESVTHLDILPMNPEYAKQVSVPCSVKTLKSSKFISGPCVKHLKILANNLFYLFDNQPDTF